MIRKITLGRIKKDPTQIFKIKNPTHDFLIKAIDVNYRDILYIDNPDQSLIKHALRKNVVILRDLPTQSDEINHYAVTVDPRALKYIQNPNEDMQMAAVMKNGLMIGLIDNPSVAVQRVAVRNTAQAITRIKFPHLDAQLIALADDYKLINQIETPHITAIEYAIRTMQLLKHHDTIDLTKHELPTDQWWMLVREFPEFYKIMNLNQEQKMYAIFCS